MAHYKLLIVAFVVLLPTLVRADADQFCRYRWLEITDKQFNANERQKLLAVLSVRMPDIAQPTELGKMVDPLFATKPTLETQEKARAALDAMESRILDTNWTPADPAAKAAVTILRDKYAKASETEKTAIKQRILMFIANEPNLFGGTPAQQKLAHMRFDTAVFDDPKVTAQREGKTKDADFDAAVAADVERRKQLGLPPIPRQGDRAFFDRLPIYDKFAPIDGNAVGEVNPLRGQ